MRRTLAAMPKPENSGNDHKGNPVVGRQKGLAGRLPHPKTPECSCPEGKRAVFGIYCNTKLKDLQAKVNAMPRFHEPDLTVNFDSPFVRDANNKLIRRSYWLDMDDRTLVMVMTRGIGANLTNDEKRAHLADIKREHLIDQVCVQEILPPEK